MVWLRGGLDSDGLSSILSFFACSVLLDILAVFVLFLTCNFNNLLFYLGD